MFIDQEKCKGCAKCIPYCPVSAIIAFKRDKAQGIDAHAIIVSDECVECGACYRAKLCATNAIVRDTLPYPRVLRQLFSDPWFSHPGTDIPGRGTEEMKTNEVTGRFWDGYIGIGLEFGRPALGCRLKETEKAFKRLLPLGFVLEPKNPLTQLIADPKTGALKPEVREEKVLSAIVEGIVPLENAERVFQTVKELAEEIDTVFSLDVIGKVTPDGKIPARDAMKEAGFEPSLAGKTNVGLGRPLFKNPQQG
ncbi:MAG: 4Fe-4S binding protein [Chloroflexi bacterium]|nr:4Fe-4S binding protein [Chloroflexota bacterium]